MRSDLREREKEREWRKKKERENEKRKKGKRKKVRKRERKKLKENDEGKKETKRERHRERERNTERGGGGKGGGGLDRPIDSVANLFGKYPKDLFKSKCIRPNLVQQVEASGRPGPAGCGGRDRPRVRRVQLCQRLLDLHLTVDGEAGVAVAF